MSDTDNYNTLTLLEKAIRLVESHVGVVPVYNGTKTPAFKPLEIIPYRSRLANRQELEEWFGGTFNDLALMCGKVSGNLLVIDIDDMDTVQPYIHELGKHLLTQKLGDKAVIVLSKRGYKLLFRCETAVGTSRILARSVDGKTLIETQAESKPCIVDKPGYKIVQGDLTCLSVITEEEMNGLLVIAETLNKYVEPAKVVGTPKPPAQTKTSHTGLLPGEDYNQRGDYESLMERQGWTRGRTHGDTTDLYRPGKTPGQGATISATSGHGGKRGIFCFSCNAAPFNKEQGYTPFQIYTLLEHGGVLTQSAFSAAAKALSEQGFGERHEPDRKTQPQTPVKPVQAPYSPPVTTGQGTPLSAPDSLSNLPCIVTAQGIEIDRDATAEERQQIFFALFQQARRFEIWGKFAIGDCYNELAFGTREKWIRDTFGEGYHHQVLRFAAVSRVWKPKYRELDDSFLPPYDFYWATRNYGGEKDKYDLMRLFKHPDRKKRRRLSEIKQIVADYEQETENHKAAVSTRKHTVKQARGGNLSPPIPEAENTTAAGKGVINCHPPQIDGNTGLIPRQIADSHDDKTSSQEGVIICQPLPATAVIKMENPVMQIPADVLTDIVYLISIGQTERLRNWIRTLRIELEAEAK